MNRAMRRNARQLESRPGRPTPAAQGFEDFVEPTRRLYVDRRELPCRLQRRSERGTHTGLSLSARAGGVRYPSPSGAFGGTVNYQLDGAQATTEVDAVASGASVSGTAVTALREGTHTVQLACATRNGDNGPSAARPSRPRSQASMPATGRRSSSRTARPADRDLALRRAQKPVATATPSWHRPISPTSVLRASTPWSPGSWCPRLIPRPDRERSQSPRRRRRD